MFVFTHRCGDFFHSSAISITYDDVSRKRRAHFDNLPFMHRCPITKADGDYLLRADVLVFTKRFPAPFKASTPAPTAFVLTPKDPLMPLSSSFEMESGALPSGFDCRFLIDSNNTIFFICVSDTL